jgi:hypothetical protein
MASSCADSLFTLAIFPSNNAITKLRSIASRLPSIIVIFLTLMLLQLYRDALD